jgi:hypothetical protein
MDSLQLRLFADQIGVGYKDAEDEELRGRIRRESHED